MIGDIEAALRGQYKRELQERERFKNLFRWIQEKQFLNFDQEFSIVYTDELETEIERIWSEVDIQAIIQEVLEEREKEERPEVKGSEV